MSELISRQNDLLHRIAEYFKEWDGSEPAPTMEINIDDLRFIAHLNVERCALQSELKAIKSQPPADQCAFDFERVIETLNNRYDLAYELYKGTCSEYQAGRMEAYDTAVRVIEEYSNCEPADQWIPCSERQPEEPDFYLATVINGQGEATTQKMLFNGKGWHRDMPWKITAWMPLPEPYKGEQHEHD